MSEPNNQSASRYVTCRCKNCGGGIEFPHEGSGQEIQCPHCGKIIFLQKPFSRYTQLTIVAIASLGIGVVAVFLILQIRHKTEPNSYASQPKETSSSALAVTKVSDAKNSLIEKAKSGDAFAQDNLGLLYLQGEDGMQKNQSEAVKWFQQSAEQGYALAQNHLGYCYAEATGISRNYEEAVKWWIKAANQGNTDAEFNLGQNYYDGLGVEKNLNESVKWFRAAAEKGHARAQYNLGACYSKGVVVADSDVEAVKWFRRAAEQGDPLAQYALASECQTGQGISQDSIEAYKWYGLALAGGLNSSQMRGTHDGDIANQAAADLNLLKAQMTSTQIEEAQKRIHAFVPQNPSVVAPSESSETVLFIDPSGSFDIRINRILIGQRAVDENVFYQNQLDDLRARNKEIVYFDISLKNVHGTQEHQLEFDNFSLQDKQGNTYSCEQTSDYIHGSVLLGKTGRGGVAFAVEKGSIPTTLTYDTGFVYADTDIKIFAKAASLDKLPVFQKPVGSER